MDADTVQKIEKILFERLPDDDDGMERIRGYKKWRGVTVGFMSSDEFLEKIESIKFRPTDTIIFAYVKCGTTFIGDITRDLLIESGKLKPDQRTAYIIDMGIDVDRINEAPEDIPRLMLTHLPWNALPDDLKLGKYKMLGITRNPKDVFCSAYPFFKRVKAINEEMSMDKFLDIYLTDDCLFGNYFEWHRQWWKQQPVSNLLMCHFEDMRADLLSAVRAIKDFLNLDLTDEQIEKVMLRNQFEAKKAAKEGFQQKHLRKGQVGGWKEELTEEQIARLDAWIEEGRAGLEGFDLKC